MKTKKFFKDPLLVWMEIQSFIKGSIKALDTGSGYLQEESYATEVGKKMAPNYLEEDRRYIYQCFLEYRDILLNQSKQYQCHRLFDECDMIHNLFHRLQKLLKQQKETEQEITWYIDNFYVDEVQDFTQAELTLLLMCSKMPNGMFCTGDTAQSIMKGVFFRFEDLKSKFWMLAQAAQHNELVSVPQLRVLTDNFRTHSDILKLAQSVISVMKSTFKRTFQDSVLPSEVAMFEGPKPILLDLYSEKDLALILLGNKEDGSVQSVELGAHQAIIVRNEEKKHKLPDSLKNGIVLTTLEAKGLEFNDVLLYDFFNDSEVDEQWRLLYNLCDNSDDETSHLLNIKPYPISRMASNLEEKLKSLLAELKHLYTALTRAKVNLWIYDKSENRLPAFYFWLTQNLATLVKKDDFSDENREKFLFAAPSEKEQWAKQGDYYFKMRQWKLAMTCYDQAEIAHQSCIAKAYMLVEKTKLQSRHKAVTLYREAAVTFLKADQQKHCIEYIEKACLCLQKCGMHVMSAKLLEKLNMIELAAKEWAKTDEYEEYARVLEILKDYSGVIKAYVAAKNYKTALQKAVEYQQKQIPLQLAVMPQQIASEYISHQVNEGNKENVHGILWYISDGSIKAEFLKEIGMYHEAVDELLREGHYQEAYRILKAQGMFDEGINKAKDSHTKDMFSLFHARKMYFASKPSTILTEILKSSDNYILAQAYCLYALINSNASFYHKAIKAFNECKCEPGKLIAFQGLLNLSDGSNVKVEEVIQMSRLAMQCTKVIIAHAEQKLMTLQQHLFKKILQVHDLEEKEHCYCIPEISYSNTEITGLKLHSAFDSKDVDGMIMLQKDKVDEILLHYYKQLKDTWLGQPDLQDHFTQIIKRLGSYRFHCELQLQLFEQAHDSKLDKYFGEVIKVIEFHTLCSPEIQEHKIMKHVAVSLFSFHSAFFLREQGSLVKLVQSLPLVSRKYFEEAAYKMLEKEDANLDDFYLAWNLLVSFVPDPLTGGLRAVLKEKVNKNDSFVLHYDRKTHIFFWWLHAYKQITFKGYVNGACHTVFCHILLRLPELVIKRDNVISVATLTYILTVLSTSLFVVANISMYSHYNDCPFIVPRLYETLIDGFGGTYGRNIIKMACYFNSKNNAHAHTNSIQRLQFFLNFLLGKSCAYNLLQNALSSENYLKDGSSLNCLILCLVLVSNLLAYIEKIEANNKETKAMLQSSLQTIHEELHKCRKSNLTTPTFVQEAYEGLKLASTVSDIFKVIAGLLDMQTQSPEMVCPVPSMNLNYTVLFELIHTQRFPQGRIKKLVILENPEEEASPLSLPEETAGPAHIQNSEMNSPAHLRSSETNSPANEQSSDINNLTHVQNSETKKPAGGQSSDIESLADVQSSEMNSLTHVQSQEINIPAHVESSNISNLDHVESSELVGTASDDQIDELDDEDIIDSVATSDIIEDGICLACGIKLHDHDMKGRSNQVDVLLAKSKMPTPHFETEEHLQKVDEYKNWKKLLDSIKTKQTDLVELFEKQENEQKLVQYRSLIKRSKSKYNMTLAEMEIFQQLSDWSSCIYTLRTYQENIKEFIKEMENLKEQIEVNPDNHSIAAVEEVIELLPQNFDKPFIWSKKSKK